MNIDKENRHPNRPRVQEGDISKISKQYILEGQYLKVKGIFDCERGRLEVSALEKKQQEPIKNDNSQCFDSELYYRLEYLEELGALNQEQQQILQEMRSMNFVNRQGACRQKQSRKSQLSKGFTSAYFPNQNIQNFNPYFGTGEMLSSEERGFPKYSLMQQANHSYFNNQSEFDCEEYY